MTEHSLWLLPSAQDEATLRETIDRLTALMGGARFAPHVTIHGDVDLPRAALLPLAQSLARQIPVQRWTVDSVGSEHHFFRCLYLRFDDNPAFGAMQATVLAAAGNEQGRSPFAHLSLAYAKPHPGKQSLGASLAAAFAGRTLTFDRVAVVRCSRHVPLAEWAIDTRFPLSPSALSPSALKVDKP